MRDAQGRLLVGKRVNRPARGTWFVPGSRLVKDERLDDAFLRITREELGLAMARTSASFLGLFEHFYEDNLLEETGYGTHYVVLAHELRVTGNLPLPKDQHAEYRWVTDAQALADPLVHPNTKAYCK